MLFSCRGTRSKHPSERGPAITLALEDGVRPNDSSNDTICRSHWETTADAGFDLALPMADVVLAPSRSTSLQAYATGYK